MRVPMLTSCTILALLVAALPASAQRRDDDHTMGDFARGLRGPNWNLSINGGTNSTGRFLLQNVGAGQRALRTENGFSVGGNVGVDVLPRMGVRLGYSFGKGDLAFRTDNGDDSDDLDAKVGDIRSHVASLELIRYLLSTRSSVAPYATAGVIASWWGLDNDAENAVAGGTQFRLGGTGSVGLRLRATRSLDVRLEAASASVRNPFTGNDSFRVPGETIDEPSRVSRSTVRLMVGYNFGRSDRAQAMRYPPRRR